MKLAENIAAFRNKLGFTQERLAELCNVSRQAVAKWENGTSEPSIDKLIILSKIFCVSIDELVKDNFVPNIVSSHNRIELRNHFKFSRIEMYIKMINDAEYLDAVMGGQGRYGLLEFLYLIIREKYIDLNDEIRDKFLICNSSMQEREHYVFWLKSFYNKDEENCCNRYIQGKCEIDEVFNTVLEELKNRCDEAHDRFEKKRQCDTLKVFCKLFSTAGIEDFENYSDKYLKDIVESLHERIQILEGDSFIDKLEIFFAKEIEQAINDKDMKYLDEIWNELLRLQDYFHLKAMEKL